eukprot:gene53543-49620_t
MYKTWWEDEDGSKWWYAEVKWRFTTIKSNQGFRTKGEACDHVALSMCDEIN